MIVKPMIIQYKDGWINVKDKMPQDQTRVIAIFGDYIFIPYWNGVCWTKDNSILKDDVITHWMPLPEPPK